MTTAMKPLLLLPLLVLIVNGELSAKERHQIGLKCMKQIGIDRRVIQDAIAGHIPENDIKYKDFLACSYKKQGYQNENGEILIENIKDFLQRFYDRSDLNAINGCAEHQTSNHGENAYNALTCIISQLKTLSRVKHRSEK